MEEEYVPTEETRERFARAVVEMCDVFGKTPDQYDSFINAFWRTLGKVVPIDKFEEQCREFMSSMYRMPVPRHFIATNERREEMEEDNRPAMTAEELKAERINEEGRRLIQAMTDEDVAVIKADALMLVEMTLGDLGAAIGPKVHEAMLKSKMHELAYKRRNRKGGK